VQQSAQRTPRAGWRYRAVGLVAAIVLILAASLAIVLSSRTAGEGPGSGANGSDRAGVTRELAAAWVARQVSRDAVVLCDRVTCTALARHGFPSGHLRVLGRALPDPLSAAVVVVTAAVRDQFGGSLSSRWTPTVIASFGSGPRRIDIRAIAPRGTAAYEAALNADLRLRKAAGSALIGSRQIVVSAKARKQLAAGQVDSRLLLVITVLAAQNPIDIVGFGSVAPRASPGTPLRLVDLAETDPAAHRPSASYVRSMVAALSAQNPPYRPAHVQTLRLADGQAILRIDFAAPSPLGLLSPQNP
jgi:hypothetical protein